MNCALRSHISKSVLILIILLSCTTNSYAQYDKHRVDSLLQKLAQHPQKDTTRIDILAWLGEVESLDHEKSIAYLKEAIDIAKKIKNNRVIGLWTMLGWSYMNHDDYPRSIAAFQALFNVSKPETEVYAAAYHFIGMNYKAQGDWEKALSYTMAGYEMDQRVKAKGIILDQRNDVGTPWNLGEIYLKKNVPDTALMYGRRGYEVLTEVDTSIQEQFRPMITRLLANTFILLHQKDSAKKYLDEAISSTGPWVWAANQTIENTLALAKWYLQFGSLDSALSKSTIAYEAAKKYSYFETMYQAAQIMRQSVEKKGLYALALQYNDLAIAVKDSMQGVDKIKKSQAMHYERQLGEQHTENLQKQLTLNNRIKLLGLSSLFIGLGGISLYRNNQRRKKTISTLNKQNGIIETQKVQLQSYIEDLRDKQTQLIHAEKMASLGELTAGIAHEIQNPLNFVNNFSEINKELIFELKEELLKDKDQKQASNVIELLNDMESNTSKIYLHGKRAESIVRSMLEHSQAKPGQKLECDLNALAEEFLKLSYHVARAKDKTLSSDDLAQVGFNANLITELDPSIPTLSIIPSDVGRVLLNIFNNAFYSMGEKEKKLGNAYLPTLLIRSQVKDHHVEIIIKDNGLGIAENIRSKIFQPFFTTKPTGHGTGLGLSLSYDIITKAHGGTLEVASVEGEYCEFKISLPADII